MNCDCISSMETKLANHVRPQAGDDAKAVCAATVFGLTDTSMYLALRIPFRVKGSKKGYTGERGKEVPISAAFCPFCGRDAREGRYRVGHDDGLDAAFGFGSEVKS